MSGTYVLWVNNCMGWTNTYMGSWDLVCSERRAVRYGKTRVTFCPPGHTPSAVELLDQLS